MLEAEHLCDRVAFLHEGDIKAIGTPRELKEQYSENTITIEKQNGEVEVIHNEPEQAQLIYDLMNTSQIKRIYTNEPNLGEIFMTITGRDLT